MIVPFSRVNKGLHFMVRFKLKKYFNIIICVISSNISFYILNNGNIFRFNWNVG